MVQHLLGRRGAARIALIPQEVLQALNDADSSPYVRNSVANWLNDASRTQPAWVEDLCERWSRDSASPETSSIVRRALRTLREAATRP